MIEIGKCEKCKGIIDVECVSRTVKIPSSPRFVALVYECSFCLHRGRIACPVDEWSELSGYEPTLNAAGRAIRAAQIELDAVDSAAELLALWASYPGEVIVEPGLNRRCTCKDCERRYGRT